MKDTLASLVEVSASAARRPLAIAEVDPRIAANATSVMADQAAIGQVLSNFVQNAMREAGSVGLGLAISRRIVQEHNGRIWAENRKEGGARLCFALPSVAESLPAAA